MTRHSFKTLGFENIVLNLNDGVVISMTVGDLRKIITDSVTRAQEEQERLENKNKENKK